MIYKFQDEGRKRRIHSCNRRIRRWAIKNCRVEKGDDGGARRRYISSFSASGINRRWLDAWSLEGAASKIYRSIKMIARPAAASETAFRGFISRRCIKHAYSRQVAGERNWTTIPGDLFTRLAARSITFHRQPEMNGLFARCFHDTRLPANAIFLLRWQKGLLSLNSLSIWRNVFIWMVIKTRPCILQFYDFY